jgi:hypothetical protein
VVRTFNDTITAAAAGLPQVQLFDAETAFSGRRLCENTVGLLEERGVASWTTPGAVRGGRCSRSGNGLTSRGEPVMALG